jgi:hypothetical protein
VDVGLGFNDLKMNQYRVEAVDFTINSETKMEAAPCGIKAAARSGIFSGWLLHHSAPQFFSQLQNSTAL